MGRYTGGGEPDGLVQFLAVVGMCACLSLAALCVVGAVSYLTRGEPPPLVGYACEGARGPLYAYEEDHFPVCKEIKRRD